MSSIAPDRGPIGRAPDAVVDENTGPSVSFIIEWDNARLSELGRTRQLLKTLQEQVIAHRPRSRRPPQFIILYDKGEVDPDIINLIVGESVDSGAWDATIAVIPTDGLKYYQLKNYGASQSDGDVIILIDSDVIPDPGWFDALMSVIDNPEVEVACGNTYVSMETFFSKAFSMFWFFEIKAITSNVYPIDKLFANNVAFKRETFERFPFPELDSFRGQCLVLSEQLRREGLTIYRHDGARVSHPPTNGFTHFCKRAICAGHDEVTIDRLRNPGSWRHSPPGSIVRLGRELASMLRRTARHRRDVGLSVYGAAGAVVIGASYLLLSCSAEIITWVNPKLVRRYFSL